MYKNPPILSKDYYEQYAKLSLAEFEIENNLEVDDKPDLQDKSTGVGIEVVRAITDEEGFSQNVFNKYSGQGLTSNELLEKNECKNKKFCWDIDPTSPKLICTRIVDAKSFIKIAAQKIREKAQKSACYKNISVCGLYIFSDLETSQIPELCNIIAANNFPFDRYFINMHNKLVVIDSKEPDKFKEYRITQEQIERMRNEAREYEIQKYREKSAK